MTIKFTTRQTCIRTLRQGDPKWLIVEQGLKLPLNALENTKKSFKTALIVGG